MRKTVLFLMLLLGLSVASIFPLFQNGFFEFHDNTQVVRVYEMSRSLSFGTFPVRWVWELGYGFGYPIFNFYGPLPYYIGGVIASIGVDLVIATKIMIGLGFVASAFTMFFLIRTFFGNIPALVSAVFYLYLPYHAVNLYVRGAIGELYAYAFLPLVFLGLFHLYKSKNIHLSVLITAVGVMGVAVSHNLTTFMLIVVGFIFVLLCLILVNRKVNFLFFSLMSFALGLLLAASFIIPAFLEMNYTNVSSQLGGGANYPDHFVCISQYVNSQWGFGGSIPGCVDGMSFRFGKVHLLLVAVGVAVLLWRVFQRKVEEGEKIAVISLCLLLVCLLLTLSVSKPIWDSVPLMAYIQYPWRFINFIGLFASILIGYAIFVGLLSKYSKLIIGASCGLLILIIGFNLKLFNPQNHNSLQSSYYKDHSYIQYTVSKISDEYLPKGFKKPANISELPISRIELRGASGNIGLLESSPTYLKASFESQGSGLAHANIAYFPSWKANVNGKEVSIKKVNDGMDIEVSGNGVIEFRFGNTPLQNIANAISVIAFLSVFVSIILLLKKKYGK